VTGRPIPRMARSALIGRSPRRRRGR
jgi:hypothetical protein